MSEKTKSNLIKYGCSIAFVVVLGFLYLRDKDLPNLPLKGQIRYWADVFTAGGALQVLVGCLIWATTKGALDGISYAASMAIRSLIPFGRTYKDERYGDYVERKRAKRAKGYGFLFVAGGIVLAVGLILTAVFYCV